MNPVVTAVFAGALIIAGKWARGEQPNIDNAVGVAGIAIGLAVLSHMSERLSNAFAVLILVTIAVVHLPTIAKSLGYSK